jgi:hypothetical protein
MLGFGMIVYSIVFFDQMTPFPSLYALVPTVGTGFIILSAVPNTLVHRLLSVSPIVGFGLISYSAYLWHQPILAFSRYRILSDHSDLLLIVLCTASFLMAYVSWRWVEKPFREKGLINRKSIFRLSVLTTFAFICIGFLIVQTTGFSHIERHQIKTAKYSIWLKEIGVKNYVFDNRKLAEDSYNILREISNDPGYKFRDNEYDRELWFDISNPKKKLLLIGNSHSKDLFSVFHNSDEILSIFQIARYGTELSQIDEEFFQSPNYESSEYIIIVSKYSDEDLVSLPATLNRMLLDGKKVFVSYEMFEFSEKYFDFYNLADYKIFNYYRRYERLDQLASHINDSYSSEFYASRENPTSDWRVKREELNKLADINGQIIFLDRMEYICDDEAGCSGVDKNLQKMIYDYGHHTSSGAKVFGKRLHESKFFRELISNL